MPRLAGRVGVTSASPSRSWGQPSTPAPGCQTLSGSKGVSSLAMASWSGPSSRNPGQSTPPLLCRQGRPVTTSTWSPPPPARQGPLSCSVSPRKVSGRPAGPVCPVVSGTRPVVVGMASVVGTAVVAGRVVEVAGVVVGTGLVVEESTRAGPDPPQPARAQAATTASYGVQCLAGACSAGFPPEPLRSPP